MVEYIEDRELIEEVFQGLLRMVYKSKQFSYSDMVKQTAILGNVQDKYVEEVFNFITNLIDARASQ